MEMGAYEHACPCVAASAPAQTAAQGLKAELVLRRKNKEQLPVLRFMDFMEAEN